MREVSQFVIVFPGRFIGRGNDEWKLLMRAMEVEYPQYQFEPMKGHNLDEEFKVIPVVGRVGDTEDDDPDRVYMCKPLDPRVIPGMIKTLQDYETLGAAMN